MPALSQIMGSQGAPSIPNVRMCCAVSSLSSRLTPSPQSNVPWHPLYLTKPTQIKEMKTIKQELAKPAFLSLQTLLDLRSAEIAFWAILHSMNSQATQPPSPLLYDHHSCNHQILQVGRFYDHPPGQIQLVI